MVSVADIFTTYGNNCTEGGMWRGYRCQEPLVVSRPDHKRMTMPDVIYDTIMYVRSDIFNVAISSRSTSFKYTS